MNISSKLSKRTLISLYWLTCVFQVFSVFHYNFIIKFLSKPLGIPSLITCYLLLVKKVNNTYLVALVLSFIGGYITSMNKVYFPFALIVFLIVHILYAVLLSKYVANIGKRKILIVSIPFFSLLIIIVYLLYPYLGKKLIPVILYGISSVAMGTLAFVNYLTKRSKENLWWFLGVFIFIVADCISVVQNNRYQSRFFEVVIILSYFTAQFLIFESVISKQRFEK